jgi:O-6-methylguanine DNA methyltransferase
VGAHRGDCIVVGVRVARHLYVVDGWGVGELWHADGVVVQHDLATPALEQEFERSGVAAHDGFVAGLCCRFEQHLRGRRMSYDDIVLDLDWATPFQTLLAASARAIPWGEVVSYGELAASAGRPGAARAAGSFCAENRFSLVIPCHRIVAASGIGGYGPSGVARKRRLLELEGVTL